ncbi:NAD(P)-binding domain-containing protein [Nocardia brasiliensis]
MVQIGVIGAGILGGTLARRLATVGNTVQVANSREPESLSDLLIDGMSAGWAADVAAASEILFLALPYSAVQKAAALIAEHAGPETIIVDTGNYYPGRDGVLPGLGDTDNPAPDTRGLREQGLSFDQLIDAMAADTEDAVSKVHDAQK